NCATALSICFVAAPSDSPGARLNEIVATGNCPRWLTATGAERISMRAKLLSGMICSRVPESAGTGCVVPGVVVVVVEGAFGVVAFSVACDAAAAPTAPFEIADDVAAPPGVAWM